MWEDVLECIAERRTAVCIPIPGGEPFRIYWYGVLAAVGIFFGALYASKHVELEGEDPDTVWDVLLLVLIPALIGARLWYVLQLVLAGDTRFSVLRPLDIFNTRLGGMNIFGGVLLGAIALIIYARVKKLDGWLMADAGLMGMFIGHGIGRIGNYVNQELYGPPTGSSWFGVLIPAENRIPPWIDTTLFPVETTRFHPTFFYEAIWLFLSFGVLYYLFRRYQERVRHGMMAGGYLVLAGIGRFIIEFWRPDQPYLPGTPLTFSRVISLLYVALGVIILLDRTGHVKLPWIRRPQTLKQRERAFREIQAEQRRRERLAARAKESALKGRPRQGKRKNGHESALSRVLARILAPFKAREERAELEEERAVEHQESEGANLGEASEEDASIG